MYSVKLTTKQKITCWFRGQKKKWANQSKSGVDVNRTNSYEQTALDVVGQCGTLRGRTARDMKKIIREAVFAVQARAIKEYNSQDSAALTFREGEIITVLEQNVDGRWRGMIYGQQQPRSGTFPSSCVAVIDRSSSVGGMNRPNKPSQVKKVSPPVVPDTSNQRNSGSSFGSSSFTSGYGSTSSREDRNSYGSVGHDDTFPPPPPPHALQQSPYTREAEQQYYRPAVSHPTVNLTQPHLVHKELEVTQNFPPQFSHQVSMEDQGIDMTQSPGRDSPGSSGSSTTAHSRNSSSSLDSGRASGSVFDGRTNGHVVPQVSNNSHRLSGQSYESNSTTSSRHSYHSSSSSLGSMDREESTTCLSTINIQAMISQRVPDHEILTAWLTDLHYEDYVKLFLQAGYDMGTIAKMCPEDLNAIGVTKPAHRRKLKSEIARLNIPDNIPDYIPDTLDQWLTCLRLPQYLPALLHQHYNNILQVTELTWEDLEEIGICKLGHQKKLMLAIKRVKDIMSGKRVPSAGPTVFCGPQEIAITTTNPHNSPSHDKYNNSAELKTFQQPIAASRAGATRHVVQAQVHSNRGIQSDHTNYGQYYNGGQVQQWRQHRSYDDGDITPTNELVTMYDGGGGTLPRQRSSVKPRPVAMIAATKTRHTETGYIDDNVDKDKLYHSYQYKPGYGSLKKQPPPIPRRTDDVKLFPVVNHYSSDEFPPPPSPLCQELHPPDSTNTTVNSIREKMEQLQKRLQSSSPVRPNSQNSDSDTEPVFLQRRNDSNASFKSTSSTESTDSLPFANENAGTIKQQKANRIHAQLNNVEVVTQQARKLGAIAAPTGSGTNFDPGDVLSDIGNMLADLTTELDAMLESEQLDQ